MAHQKKGNVQKGKFEACYKCGKPAVSREHVPPLCIFPEGKELGGINFRNNLITVPSCDLHNSKKSKDDEFLMASLAGIIENNMVGYYHSKTKVKRALERRDNSLFNAIFKEPKAIIFKSQNGNELPVIQGIPDFDRLINCFENIAYGLYYHKFNKKFEGECKIIIGFIKYNDPINEKYKLFCKKRFELEPVQPKIEGANPEIFKFQFVPPDSIGLIALKIVFYGGTEIFIAFKKKGIKIPFDLTTELIKAGKKVFIKLGDEHIEFN